MLGPTILTSFMHETIAACSPWNIPGQRAGIGVVWIVHRIGELEPVGLSPGYPSQNSMRDRLRSGDMNPPGSASKTTVTAWYLVPDAGHSGPGDLITVKGNKRTGAFPSDAV